jgi:hypothetical protein
VALLGVLVLVGCCGHSAAQSEAPRKARGRVGIAGEYLLRFKPGTDAVAMERALSDVEVVHRFRVPADLYSVRSRDAGKEAAIVADLAQRPEVVYIEPNQSYYASGTVDYTPFSKQWALTKINAAPAWAAGKAKGMVCVATLDSGIDFGKYPELQDLIWTNPVEASGSSGKDDDGNGYIDDIHGFMAVGAPTPSVGHPVPAGNPTDNNGHGTWVAGVIAGVVGAVDAVVKKGPLPNIRIIPCKFLNAGGIGTTEDAVRCLEYVASIKDHNECNVVATNNSWGEDADSFPSKALSDAIAAQRDRGILFVVAAGNLHHDLDPDNSHAYPANYAFANVLTVGGTSDTDAMAVSGTGSNFGRHSVHVAAPGFQIAKMEPTPLTKPKNSSWSTSLATPHVTGLIALLNSQPTAPTWTAVRNLVLAGGTPLTKPTLTASGRRITISGSGGLGSMTCSGQVVQARLLPSVNAITISTGQTVDLAALHINCDKPNGAPSVQVQQPDGTVVAVTLLDDGVDPDQVKTDGIYAVRWKPLGKGVYVLTFPNSTPQLVQADRLTVTVH